MIVNGVGNPRGALNFIAKVLEAPKNIVLRFPGNKYNTSKTCFLRNLTGRE